MQLLQEGTPGNLAPGFSWIKSHTPFPFADSDLYPFTVINQSMCITASESCVSFQQIIKPESGLAQGACALYPTLLTEVCSTCVLPTFLFIMNLCHCYFLRSALSQALHQLIHQSFYIKRGQGTDQALNEHFLDKHNTANLVINLALPGLSCGMKTPACGIQFPDQELNPALGVQAPCTETAVS